jgi:hypothetical protein
VARSEIVTLIPLDRAAVVLGLDPAHFNTIVTSRRPENNACDDLWFPYAWQRVGQAGREDLANALYQAESQVIRYLGYYPMPTWIAAEEHPITKPYAVELRNISGRNSRNQQKSVRTTYGYVIEAGSKAKTLIQATAAVTYSDADNDGYNELATVTVTTAVTDPDEIRVYFAAKSGKDAWEIRPASVSITSGTATITFSRFLVPLPQLWEKDPDEGDRWRTIDGDSSSNFITTADVYRVYTDPSVQATFYHEDTCSSCGGTGCSVCNFTTETACLRVRDSRLGLMSYAPATWNATTLSFGSGSCCSQDPDKIKLYYRAGYVDKRRETISYKVMDPEWERAIVYYAFTLLEREASLCGNSQNIYQRFNEDLALSVDGRSWTLSFKHVQNPLGTTRAAINLWRMIERDRLI